MIVIEGRFEVKLISHLALQQYMAHRDNMSVRKLARRVQDITGKPCSHQVIGHLRSGKRNTCKPETARAIEKALDAPAGSLFWATVSRVAREVERSGSAA